MPPRKRLAAAPDPKALQPRLGLREAVERSLAAMDWLTASDEALRVVAVRLAGEIETATDRAEELAVLVAEFGGDRDMFRRLQKLEAMCDVTKVVGWLGPQLQGVLRDLGGTPAARAAMNPDRPVGGRLAQLRASAAGKHDS